MVDGASIQDAREHSSRCCDFPYENPPMNRKIHDHKVNGLNEAIEVTATDAPGPGGANHEYRLTLLNKSATCRHGETSGRDENYGYMGPATVIHFQNGPIGEAGFNGLSNEALLAVLIDRMRGFQHLRKAGDLNGVGAGEFDFNSRGQFACRENATALTHLEEAMMWLQKRTRDRMARGVEGTHSV